MSQYEVVIFERDLAGHREIVRSADQELVRDVKAVFLAYQKRDRAHTRGVRPRLVVPVGERALDDREKLIVRERFGLRGGPGRTLREIGDELGLSGSRIRELEGRALRKLIDHYEKCQALEGDNE